jgi:hypothetical protein
MKSFFLLLSACTLFAATASSQSLGKIYYGIKGGYNYSLTTYTAAESEGAHGGYAGVMMKIPFDNRLFFAPQIDFNYRGMKAKTLPANELSKVTELQIRVMPVVQIDFKHPDKNENTMFVMIGPSLGFGVGGKQIKQDQNGTPVSGKLKYGFQDYGQYDASWHTGLGYETTNGLRLLLDYALGLSNMMNRDGGPNLKFHTISAGVGYWFGKKK